MTDDLTRRPHDPDAEQAYLGGIYFTTTDTRHAHQLVNSTDFYKPAHATIHTAMGLLIDRGEPVDPITLANILREHGDLNRVGGPSYLHTLANASFSAANCYIYADLIRDLAQRRALIEAGIRITQLGLTLESGPTTDITERAVTMTRDVRDAGRAHLDTPTEDILDFVQHQDTYDWIVPGLLERMDRLILTASEGGGKSTLLRQIAVTLAAGIHPFRTWETITPVRVLTLDCENSAASSRRKFIPLLNAAQHLEQPVKRGQFHIECRPEGLDLTRGQDRAWVMRRIETIQPDVLIIGPIYRLHAGDPNSEELARKVSVVLDDARATGRCAVLMEAHAPHHNGLGAHRNLRPLGSSLWMRWPEFGFGLRPVEDEKSAENVDGARGRRVVPWRGMRDERDWPRFIRQGERWPWTAYRPIDADGYGNSDTGAIW